MLQAFLLFFRHYFSLALPQDIRTWRITVVALLDELVVSAWHLLCVNVEGEAKERNHRALWFDEIHMSCFFLVAHARQILSQSDVFADQP